jgi:Spy/CpxP family protein refolding chaperone
MKVSFLMLCLWFGSVAAQTIPADREALLNGEGMGQASYAETNGYPGPKHVLELKSELNLTPDQTKKAQVIVQGMTSAATIKGEEIVEAEEELHSAFKAGTVNEKQLRAKLERIGKLRGELRFAHLQAHLKMKQILTPNQIAKYNELRGQTEAKHEGH